GRLQTATCCGSGDVTVVSDVEKAPARRQVGIRKTSASESLMTCRYLSSGDIKTGDPCCPWEESGGCPLTGQMVSGMEMT
ncbi:hypothetical protein AB0K16_60440, partial [Nonomuraea jabiensis]|uniref:hypothetical protein n=1 Tax=Nonomuraea jabiensis TaxID=882448 RepID=UPI00342D1658